MIGEVMKGKSAKVIDAFAVERKGEEERYRPYANLPNRTLLYPPLLSSLCRPPLAGPPAHQQYCDYAAAYRGHGTGVANVMGILRKGLCIKPIGARTSGATFGPGSTSSSLSLSLSCSLISQGSYTHGRLPECVCGDR
jgi:hypothetical protein